MAGEIAEPNHMCGEMREKAIRPQRKRFQEVIQKLLDGKEMKIRLVSVA